MAKMQKFWTLIVAIFTSSQLSAEEPSVSYIFPAGGQRGTTVHFKVGGHYLNGDAAFEMLGSDVTASSRVRETNTLWFEGPLIPLPASQQVEDYPKDHAGHVKIAANAELGVRYWRVWTSQGATAARKFEVGQWPETVEDEIDGHPIPTHVQLPVTINGRIFPREDIDVWSFHAKTGEHISCEVNAKRLGSPLEAKLELIDPQGRQIGEAIGRSEQDPRLQFTASIDGLHQVRIQDLNAGGLQHYVYRLTLTTGPSVATVYPLGGRRGTKLQLELAGHGPASDRAEIDLPKDALQTYVARLPFGTSSASRVLLDVDDLQEFVESEPNDDPMTAKVAISPPAMLNGRIAQRGDVDLWTVIAKKDESFEVDLRASRLGSPLDSVLIVSDADGKELVRSDDIGGEQTDSRLTFKSPADGIYRLRVQERFSSRGGDEFSYRLRVAPQPGPDFRLTFSSDVVNVFRDVAGLTEEEKKKRPPTKTAQLRIDAERIGGFAGEIEIAVEGLPPGVTVKGTKILEKQSRLDLHFGAAPTTKIAATHLMVRGKAKIDGCEVVRTASLPLARGEPALESVLLAVAIPTPFRARGEYLFAYGLRGSVFHRRYLLDRWDFAGSLKARLADRQVRHLQGVRGPEISIPADASEFVYPLTMPPWMEIGRTSRSAVMVSGAVKDHDGTEHIVSYSSGEQNDQIIAVVAPALLNIETDRRSMAAQPNTTIDVRLWVKRDETLANSRIKLEFVLPTHFKDLVVEPVTVPAAATEALLRIQFGPESGPFNMPVTIRATSLDSKDPHFAETSLELVRPVGALR